ncbi:MAG: transglycosylase SLT domain-containing protein [Bacteroidia bacterium]|nr:transglycosylase SLT domain-containing protein [Bacteroidia bacterium]
MDIIKYLPILVICFLNVTFAQNLDFQDNPASETTFLQDKDFSLADAELEEKAVKEALRELEKTYRFPNPTSTKYDTLLHNTNNYRSDEIPTFSPEVINRRMYSLPTIIPMEYNSYVARYIDVYAKSKRGLTSKMLGLRRVYFPIFEEVLDREGMPLEIKYLSVVESALNPHARSRVGATGLWQFMLSTGRLYKLDVNSFVDERKDPYKSTEAAAKYLKRSYEEFGDWLLAIASYNCGPGNVRKAIHRSGGKKNFWEIRKYLPRETRGYVPAFIAVNYVFKYASEYNIYPVYTDFKMSQDTLHIRKLDITMQELARMSKANVEELRYLNPELKLNRVPYSHRNYVLRVTPEVADYYAKKRRLIHDKYGKKRNQAYKSPAETAALNKTYSSYSYRPKGTKLYYYRVRSGDVVGSIAEKYGVTKRQIADWNNLYRYRIKVGQRLKIYAKPSRVSSSTSSASSTKSKSASTPPPPSNGKMKFHRVQEGENLWAISKKYGVNLSTLQSLNPGINARNLKIGQTIRVR